ncbi:MAG: SIR2 family protein, partial [Candidatus Kuenenia stuttgartiensis]|nr:SIR2 family protein [Candidatus Kuenenia stuttgartiensis]
MIADFEIHEFLYKHLKRHDVAVFCGAGISYNSGLPIVSTLLDYLFSKLEITPSQKKSIVSSNLPFESIMEIVLRESTLDEFIDCFLGGIPNANHSFIAKLAKHGHLKVICTTNFDTLIEHALAIEGLVRNNDFRVYSSEEDFKAIKWDENLIHLIKIHGCVTKREEMAITLSLIASDKYSLARQNVISTIFGGVSNLHTLVLGYSCSDIDIVPIIESLSGENGSVIFIDHNGDENFIAETRDISQKPPPNPFKDYRGLYVQANTDELVKGIWALLLVDTYFNLKVSRIKWKENIDQWYSKAIDDSGVGVKHHIASRLLYDIGEFKEAIKHHEEAISIALRDNNILAYSSELGNMAMAYNSIGDYKQAKLCLAESLPLCKRINNLQAISSQLQAYGKSLHELHEDEEAIKVYQEALHYAKLEGDEFGICCVLGNISNSYNRLGKFDQAIQSLTEAITLSRKIGNKQAESSQLGILSFTYSLLNQYEKSIDCCTSGISIKRAIGDRNG